MRFLFGILAIFASAAANAEITVVQVANGKAVIKFDPSDAITTSSTLVLQNLSIDSEPSQIAQAQVITPMNVEVKPDYKRTHLITGFLKSYTQDVTVKNGSTSVKTEAKTTEIDGNYYYNFKNFALGFSIFNKKESVDGFEDLSTSFGFGGKYFFVENISKNKAIPYAGLEFIGLSSDLYANPRIEGKMSATAIALGVLVFMADAAFLDVNYTFGSGDGDMSQGSTTTKIEFDQSGISVGVGIALE